jgi:hypothetical protein
MASIRFGNGVADARGSINGTTFSRNANGGYARNRTTPVNPRTSSQIAQRSLLTGLSSAWRNLDASIRQTWIDGTRNFPYANRLGEVSTYTGPQLYNKLNLALLSSGQASIDRCPTPESFPDLGTFAFNAIVDGTDFELSAAFQRNVPVGFSVQVFASVGVSAGRNATSTPKKLVATVQGANDPGIDGGAGYVSVYGVPVVGANLVVEFRLTNNSTGQQSTAAVGSVVVVAA